MRSMFALAVIASLCLTSRCRAEAVLLQGCVCAGSGRLLPDHPTWFWFPNSCKYTASYFVTQCENALSLATLFYPRALHRSSEAHGSNRIALGQVLPGRSKDTTAQSSRRGDAAGLSGSTSSCLLQLSEDHSTRGKALVIIMGSPVILPVLLSLQVRKHKSIFFLLFQFLLPAHSLSLTPAAHLGWSGTTC